MRQFELKENVDTIICSGDFVYLGSYDLKDNTKVGCIHKLNFDSLLNPSTDNLIYLKTVETTGTFDLKKYGSMIVAANFKDLTLFDEDLNEIKKLQTSSFNTKITIEDDLIMISDGLGYVNIYNFELNLQKSSRISKDTLWTVEKHYDLIYCGGEDSILYVLNLSDLSIKYKIEFDQGVTALHFEVDHFLVGSYDEHIYKINYNGQIITKKQIGGGIWRIERMGLKYVVTCMYEGCKLLNEQLDILETFQPRPLIYSLAIVNDKILFNSFYERILYVI